MELCVKMLAGVPASYVRVPELDPNADPVRQPALAQVVGALSAQCETWMQLLAAQPQPGLTPGLSLT